MRHDTQLFICLVSVLVALGTVMAHSASVTSRPTDRDEVYLTKHTIYLALGIAAAVITASLPSTLWPRLAPWLFAVTLLLLIFVLVPGVGTSVNGSRRWLRAGPVSFQPSELAKLTLPLFVARLVVKHADRCGQWRDAMRFLWPVGVIVPLVLLEPDLGTTLFLVAGTALMLYLAGWPLRHFAGAAAAAIPLLAAVIATRPYQLRRITGFVAGWSDSSAAPYQIQQSLVSLGAGGWTGTGLGRGWQKLSFLPEANTDFVFAVVGEELGLVGTLGVLTVWCGLFVTGLKLMSRPHLRQYDSLCGITLLTLLTTQAFVNMGVVTALLPPKGIALPLISYGGSNLVTSLVAIGLIISLSRSRSTGSKSLRNDLLQGKLTPANALPGFATAAESPSGICSTLPDHLTGVTPNESA